MYNIEGMDGAHAYWNAGYTGQGVGVALIDSGVTPVDGLSTPGKVVNGPDLSFDSQHSSLEYLDSFGHGTHMAGIIAGRDTEATSVSSSDTTHFLGMAPDAQIVSVKVANATWADRRLAGARRHRLGRAAPARQRHEHPRAQPLVRHRQLAELRARSACVCGGAGVGPRHRRCCGRGQRAAIAPTASRTRRSIPTSSPSGPPTPRTPRPCAYHQPATFTSEGDGTRNPDLSAPGVHIPSLRVPGSFIDQQFGATATVADRLFLGSGTSQAAAVVSGAAALLLSQRPGLTPDQVKALLDGNTNSMLGRTAAQGQR